MKFIKVKKQKVITLLNDNKQLTVKNTVKNNCLHLYKSIDLAQNAKIGTKKIIITRGMLYENFQISISILFL